MSLHGHVAVDVCPKVADVLSSSWLDVVSTDTLRGTRDEVLLARRGTPE